jgi:hypothetical protein
MAVLPDEDRAEAWAGIMRELSNQQQPMPWTKDVLRAAVDAVDQWANDNAAAYNAALPAAFRSTATPAQKAYLLMVVVARRHIKGV